MYLLKAYGEVGDYVEYGEDPSDLSIGVIFHDPRLDSKKYIVNELNLNLELNRSGSLTFSMPKEHRCYSSISPLKTYISVHIMLDDGEMKEYWRGRVSLIQKRMNGVYSVTCEGIMSCLNDAQFTNRSYDDDETGKVPVQNIDAVKAIENAIDIYNDYIEDNADEISICCKQFIFLPVNVGPLKPIDPLDQDSGSSSSTVWSQIESIINDNDGKIRTEYCPSEDKYLLYFTNTDFNFPEDAEVFTAGSKTNVNGNTVIEYTTNRQVRNAYPSGAYIYYGDIDYLVKNSIPEKETSEVLIKYPPFSWVLGPVYVISNDMEENTIPVIDSAIGGVIKYVEEVYKYKKGSLVLYNSEKYVFIKDHLWAAAWNDADVIKYSDYSSQTIELGVNLIDIIKEQNAANVYSHLKPYGKEIEFIDFFGECEKSGPDEQQEITYSLTRSVQSNSWYRIPLAWHMSNKHWEGTQQEGSWETFIDKWGNVVYYMIADPPNASVIDSDGNSAIGKALARTLDYIIGEIKLTQNNGIVKNNVVGFNASGNFFHDEGFDHVPDPPIRVLKFEYSNDSDPSPTIHSGSTLSICAIGNEIGLVWHPRPSEITNVYNPNSTYGRGAYCHHDGILNQCIVASATGTWDQSKWLEIEEYDSEQTYSVGDVCAQYDRLYECVSAINAAEEWNFDHWKIVHYNFISVNSDIPATYDFGSYEFSSPAYSYYYVYTGESQNGEDSLSLSISYTIDGHFDDTSLGLMPRYPLAKRNALLTPADINNGISIPIDYDYANKISDPIPETLINHDVLDLFGRIDRIEEYNDIYNRKELMRLAEDKMVLDAQKPYSASIRALDMSNLDSSKVPFYPGFNYEIKPFSTNIDAVKLQCGSIRIPLMSIKNSEYSFGIARETITNKTYVNGYWRRIISK